MSTYNICFRGEIRKILCGYPLLSVAMLLVLIRNIVLEKMPLRPATTLILHHNRARDKGSIRVKYPYGLSQYSIIFKNLGIDTQFI